MREKELRIALVCFGGVSLAVYMHGISKEILKLVRASSALHGIADRPRRAPASFFDRGRPRRPGIRHRGGLFRVAARDRPQRRAARRRRHHRGRVGRRHQRHDAGAGAQPRPADGALRDLWLDNADVSVLLSPDARAGTWSKWFLTPFIWAASKTGRFRSIVDLEVRQKLSLFVRSRWFKPPLDGRIMSGLMYDAVASMGAPQRPKASLLPSGHSLDLFVTLTDYHGHHQLVQIHDPPLIHEQDHHHVAAFPLPAPPERRDRKRLRAGQRPQRSPLRRARPRRFRAPFRRRGSSRWTRWSRNGGTPGRGGAEFIAKSFPHHQRAGIDPATVPFIDGSVLNNRPFQEAISAIHGRPAYRQVDRRLVYIDPHPAPPVIAAAPAGAGLLCDPARRDVGYPELPAGHRRARLGDRLQRPGAAARAIIDSARPQISELVAKVITGTFDRASRRDLRAWREQVNSHVARDAGFAYQAYVRLKLASVRAFGAQLIVKLRGVPTQSPLSRVVAEIVDAWAVRKGIVYERADSEALEFETQTAANLPDWVKFLLAFDVKYRERRLHFLIEGQNRLYQLIGQDRFAGLDPPVVDRLKRDFYGRLDALRRRQDAIFFSRQVRELVADIFPAAPSADEVKHLQSYANCSWRSTLHKIDHLIEQLAIEIDLDASTRDLDELLASLDPAAWHLEARREVLVNYLGFPFWDVLTFPVTSAREIGELNEILVDRISPQDARALKGFEGIGSLRALASPISRRFCRAPIARTTTCSAACTRSTG